MRVRDLLMLLWLVFSVFHILGPEVLIEYLIMFEVGLIMRKLSAVWCYICVYHCVLRESLKMSLEGYYCCNGT